MSIIFFLVKHVEECFLFLSKSPTFDLSAFENMRVCTFNKKLKLLATTCFNKLDLVFRPLQRLPCTWIFINIVFLDIEVDSIILSSWNFYIVLFAKRYFIDALLVRRVPRMFSPFYLIKSWIYFYVQGI